VPSSESTKPILAVAERIAGRIAGAPLKAAEAASVIATYIIVLLRRGRAAVSVMRLGAFREGRRSALGRRKIDPPATRW
jgi:urease gamma subunit